MMKVKFVLLAGLMALAGGAGSAQALPAAKAAGAAQTVAGTASDVVQVRRGGRHHFRGGMHRPRFHHRNHWRGSHLRHRYWGPSIRIYGGGYGRCGWLRQRAAYSGSSYWWRRYNACRYGW